MVSYIDIRVQGFNEVINYFHNLEVKIPQAIDKDLRIIGSDMRRGLVFSLRNAGLVWKGLLVEEIIVKKVSPLEWIILMPFYGHYLDSMEPHRVVVKGKPFLEQWAMEHFGEIPYSMIVTPHPWIAEGLREGGKRAASRLENGNIVRVFKKGLIT